MEWDRFNLLAVPCCVGEYYFIFYKTFKRVVSSSRQMWKPMDRLVAMFVFSNSFILCYQCIEYFIDF